MSRFLVADFETSTDVWYEKEGIARVWLWGLYDIQQDKFRYGIDIKSFIDFFLDKKNIHEIYPICYFHNLKYDGSYIVNYLLSNGYEYTNEITELKQFKTVISDTGLWYIIELPLYISRGKIKTIKFYDSLKKIPMPVRDIPKTFGFEDTLKKGELDYDTIRPVGHLPTKEELDYLYPDVVIVAKALEQLNEEGFTKITGSSDAFASWKQTLNPKVRNPEKTYRDLFPELPLEVDDFIRAGYRGGWTYVNPRFAGKIIDKPVVVYDINSMYPAKMVDKYLPVFAPRYFVGKPNPKKHECYMVRIMINFELKEGFLPTIQIKHGGCFSPTEYLASSNNKEVEIVVTNIDLKLIFRHYNIISIEYIDGYYFHKAKGFFDNHIKTNMKIKEVSVGGKRYMAKLRMNQVYGKCATAPRKKMKIPYLKDGVLKFELGEEKIEASQYTALAVFITSWARYDIITDAQNNYDNFIYCDTDSLHLLANEDGSEPKLPIHPTHLGYYKLEHKVEKSTFLRSKTYIEQYDKDTVEIKCAGAPAEVKKKMNFENFKIGNTYEGKLMPKQVKGGCILVKSFFTIK